MDLRRYVVLQYMSEYEIDYSSISSLSLQYGSVILQYTFDHSLIPNIYQGVDIRISSALAFTDNKINVTKQLKFVLGGIENIVGKRETADYQYFLLFPHFQRC